MSRSRVERKIVEWVDYTPPREWYAKLSCGHRGPNEYNDGLPDETKEVIEARGVMDCYECGEEKDRIEALETDLRLLKARKKAGRT